MPTALFLRISSCAALLAAISALGCRSAVSTHVEPDPVNGGWAKTHLRGIPITVTVPTGLEIRIVEHRYFEVPSGCVPQPVLDWNLQPLITRHVEYDIREKQEVFTVDAVRPAAGTLTYSSDFKGQYFTDFNAKNNDTTIDTITAALKNITSVLPTPPKGKSTASSPEQANMPYTSHIVAARIFDVHDPCLTQAVQEFVDEYVNRCYYHVPNTPDSGCFPIKPGEIITPPAGKPCDPPKK